MHKQIKSCEFLNFLRNITIEQNNIFTETVLHEQLAHELIPEKKGNYINFNLSFIIQ